jgi:hypothetical protein
VEWYNEEESYNLRTLVDLPVGDEVLINHKPDWEAEEHRRDKIKPMPQVRRRRAAIEKQWGFACGRDSCSKPAATDADFSSLYDLEVRLRSSHNIRISQPREIYNQRLLQMMALLTKYRLAHSLYKAIKAAATAMLLTGIWTLSCIPGSWSCVLGVETIGDTEDVFLKKDPVEAKVVLTNAKKSSRLGGTV